MGVVLAHAAHLWGRGLVPSPGRTVCPFSLSSNPGEMQEAGEPLSCDSRQQTQALGACHALSRAGIPHPPSQIPTANSLPGHNDTLQQDEVSPAGLQPKPSGIWGKPSTLPGTLATWLLMQPALEPGGYFNPFPLTACSLIPSLQQLLVQRSDTNSEGLSLHPSPKGGPLPP